MPHYLVTHKLRTVATLDQDFEIGGFRLQKFSDDPREEAWAVVDELEAPDVAHALARSRERLRPIIDALAFVTQCSFSLAGLSFMAYRLDDNPERIVYFRHLRSRPTVGMPLHHEQAADVTRLLQIENPAALWYFRQAMNAATVSGCLAMLVTAAEALAGQAMVSDNCEECGHPYSRGGTNRSELEHVVGTDAYNRLYKKKYGSLRNRLLHGKAINEDAAASLCDAVYRQIRLYLSAKLHLAYTKEIVGAPRRFESAEWLGVFIKLDAKTVPLLRELEESWLELGHEAEQPPGY